MPPEDDTSSFHDVEHAMYSHFGGQMSGLGAKHDPPAVVNFVHNTLKQHPKLLHAYHSGKVVNPPQRKIPFRRDYGSPDVIDYGGSLNALSHTENGRLVSFDHSKMSAKNFRVRRR